MKIICKSNRDYNLTKNKQYEAIELEAKSQYDENRFTWPAYVKFKDDNGKICVAHATRFETLEGQPLDEFINKKGN